MIDRLSGFRLATGRSRDAVAAGPPVARASGFGERAEAARAGVAAVIAPLSTSVPKEIGRIDLESRAGAVGFCARAQ